jgi:hypothetical protein
VYYPPVRGLRQLLRVETQRLSIVGQKVAAERLEDGKASAENQDKTC